MHGMATNSAMPRQFRLVLNAVKFSLFRSSAANSMPPFGLSDPNGVFPPHEPSGVMPAAMAHVVDTAIKAIDTADFDRRLQWVEQHGAAADRRRNAWVSLPRGSIL
jgi:hypothetical protein